MFEQQRKHARSGASELSSSFVPDFTFFFLQGASIDEILHRRILAKQTPQLPNAHTYGRGLAFGTAYMMRQKRNLTRSSKHEFLPEHLSYLCRMRYYHNDYCVHSDIQSDMYFGCSFFLTLVFLEKEESFRTRRLHQSPE